MDACYNANGSKRFAVPAKTTPIINPQNKVTYVNPKILFIGDSISANIDIKMLAHATEAEIQQVRAYSSIKESFSSKWKQAARFPDSNFTDVVPAELSKVNYHSLTLFRATYFSNYSGQVGAIWPPKVIVINMELTFYIWDFWLYPLKHIYIWGLHAYFEVRSMKNKKVAAIYI